MDDLNKRLLPCPLTPQRIFEIASPYFRWNADSWQNATLGTVGMPFLLEFTKEAIAAASPPVPQAAPSELTPVMIENLRDKHLYAVQGVIQGHEDFARAILAAAPAAPVIAQAAPGEVLEKLLRQIEGAKRRMRHTPATGQSHSHYLCEDIDCFVEEARAALSQSTSTPVNQPGEPVVYLHELPAGEVFGDAPAENRQICWSIDEADQALFAHGGTIRPLVFGAAAPVAAAPGEPVKYVPVDASLTDKYGNHPNDDEPRTVECIAALNERGDDKGQGLDGYWKWGFAAGFNAAQQAGASDARDAARFCDHCGMPHVLHNRPCQGAKIADALSTYTFGDGHVYYRKDEADAALAAQKDEAGQ